MTSDLPYPVTGAILAGGRSRRMGRDKAGLLLGGQRLIAWGLGALRPLVAEVLVIANDPAPFADLGIRVVPDTLPGVGPVGGIHAALAASTLPHVFCLACDMPFAQPAVIGYLCQLAPGFDVVVPWSGRGYEPLHAVYGRACLPVIEAMLRAGERRMEAAFPAMRTRRVEPAELQRLDPALEGFFNINTEADLEAAQRLIGRVGAIPRSRPQG